MIVEKVKEWRKSRIKVAPVMSNRASELGHPCLRYLVLCRTAWDQKVPPDETLQSIFDEGNLQEQAVIKTLLDAGIPLIELQRYFFWKEYQISGHIDAKVVLNGKAIPLEIKSCSPYIFSTISSYEDMKKSRYLHIRKYPTQMVLYLLMDNKEYGLFLFKNKVTGELKEVEVPLDWDLGEEAISKAEKANKYIQEKKLPDAIYSEETCPTCPFRHICLPEVKADSLRIEDDPELESKIKRYLELKPLATEYNRLNRELQTQLKGVDKLIVGNYLIQGKWIERKAYTVPAGRVWQKEIIKLEGGENEQGSNQSKRTS